MSIAAIAYIIVISAVLLALLRVLPNHNELSYAHDVAAGLPEDYQRGQLTSEIAHIEQQPDTPVMLSRREREEREARAEVAFWEDYNRAMETALTEFSQALTGVRDTLQQWHAAGARDCAHPVCEKERLYPVRHIFRNAQVC